MQNEKRNLLIKFILLYAVGIVLVVLVVAAIMKTPRTNNEGDEYATLFSENEKIEADLSVLYKMNEQYLTTLSFPLEQAVRDSLLAVQSAKLKPLKTKIGNLAKAGQIFDANTSQRYRSSAAAHENALNNWQAVNTFILYESGSKNASPISQIAEAPEMPKDDNKASDAQVAQLKNQLTAAQKKVAANRATLQKNEEELKFLKWAVRSQVATIKSLEGRLKN